MQLCFPFHSTARRKRAAMSLDKHLMNLRALMRRDTWKERETLGIAAISYMILDYDRPDCRKTYSQEEIDSACDEAEAAQDALREFAKLKTYRIPSRVRQRKGDLRTELHVVKRLLQRAETRAKETTDRVRSLYPVRKTWEAQRKVEALISAHPDVLAAIARRDRLQAEFSRLPSIRSSW